MRQPLGGERRPDRAEHNHETRLIAADESDDSLRVARVHELFGDAARYWMINVGVTLSDADLIWGQACSCVAAKPGSASISV